MQFRGPSSIVENLLKKRAEETPVDFSEEMAEPESLPQEEIDALTKFVQEIDASPAVQAASMEVPEGAGQGNEPLSPDVQRTADDVSGQRVREDLDGQFQEFADAMSGQGLTPQGIRNFNKPFENLAPLMDQAGFELVDTTDAPGVYKIRDLNADDPREIKTWDFNAVASELGIDPDEIDFAINAPDTALNQAPKGMDVKLRAKLAVGNVRGNITHLSKLYDAVDVDPDKGLVVRENGVWKTVDPGGISQWIDDPWEFARDFADLVDVAPYFVTIGKGAAKGSKIGGTAGAALGPKGAAVGRVGGALAGAAGAGAATSLAVSSLGRIAGTYEATPQEQAMDAFFDGMLSMGAQGVAAGVRPGFNALRGSAQFLGKHLTNNGKNIMAFSNAKMTGTTFPKARIFMDRGVEVWDGIKRLGANAKSYTDIQANAMRESVGLMRKTLEDGVRALPRKYGELLGKLGSRAEARNLTVNMRNVVDNSYQALEKQGFGRVVKEKGRAIFRPFTPEDLAVREMQGLPTTLLQNQPQTMRMIRTAIDTAEGFAKTGALKGKQALTTISNFNQQMNRISRGAIKAKDDAARRAITEINTGFKNSAGVEFQKVGLNNSYNRVNQAYATYKGSVDSARKILRTEGEQSLLNQVVNSANPNAKATGMMKHMIELTGKEGAKNFDRMVINDLVQHYAKITPNMGLFQWGVAFSALKNPANIPKAAGVMGMSSPRLAGSISQAGQRAIGAAGRTLTKMSEPTKATLKASALLRKMDKSRLIKLLGDDDAFRAFMRSTAILGKEPASTQLKNALEEMGVREQQE